MDKLIVNENLLNNNCWVGVLDGFKFFIKSVVKETMEEVINEKMCNANLEDKRLNTEELCARWNISKNTLHNWEQNKIISPLPIGGRKKVFSMKDVLEVEVNGLIKHPSL